MNRLTDKRFHEHDLIVQLGKGASTEDAEAVMLHLSRAYAHADVARIYVGTGEGTLEVASRIGDVAEIETRVKNIIRKRKWENDKQG